MLFEEAGFCKELRTEGDSGSRKEGRWERCG